MATQGFRRCRWMGASAFVVSVLLIGRGPAPQASPLSASNVDVTAMADEVSQFLRRCGQDTVSVGQFRSPPPSDASAGPGIAKLLAEELGARGITVKRGA